MGNNTGKTENPMVPPYLFEHFSSFFVKMKFGVCFRIYSVKRDFFLK